MVGTLNWNIAGWEFKTGTRHIVDRVFHHPKWSGGVGASYDIALVHLRYPIVFNDYVRPICMPSAREKFTQAVTLSGWGKTHSMLASPNPHLLTITYNLIRDEYCEYVYHGAYTKDVDLCAGGEDGKGACLVSLFL